MNAHPKIYLNGFLTMKLSKIQTIAIFSQASLDMSTKISVNSFDNYIIIYLIVYLLISQNQFLQQKNVYIETKNSKNKLKAYQIPSRKHEERNKQEIPNRITPTFSNGVTQNQIKVVLFADSIIKI